MEDSWESTIAANGSALAAAFADSRVDPRMGEVAQELAALSAANLAATLRTPQGRAWLRWALNTPEGRTWLRRDTDTELGEQPPDREIRESSILSWAFAAELRQLNIPAAQAVSFVHQGITLRDIKSQPAEELARRRLPLLMAIDRSEMTPAAVASIMHDPALQDYLVDQWKIHQTEEQFKALRRQIKSAERDWEEAPDDAAIPFLGQEVVLRDIRLKSVRKLSQSFIAQEDAGHAPLAKESGQEKPLPAAWVESRVEQWLADEFQRLRGELQRREMIWSGIPHEEATTFLEQAITLADIRTRSAQELTELFITRAAAEDAPPIQAVERAIGADELWFELDQAVQEAVPETGAVQKAVDMDPQWRDAQAKRSLFELFAWCKWQAGEAKKAGRGLFAVQHYDILVVSDFHLAAGNHPSAEGIARLSPTEDFFFDNAFFRFLHDSAADRRAREGFPYELILNGDMIDFAQVVVSDEAESGRLEPWSLPPLWLQEAAFRSGVDSRERVGKRLPARLRAILEGVYGQQMVRAVIGAGMETPELGGHSLGLAFFDSASFGSAQDAQEPEGKTEDASQGPPADLSAEDWQDWYSDWADKGLEQSQHWSQEQWDTWVYELPESRRWEDLAGEVWAEQMEQERAERRVERRKIHVMRRKDALNQLSDVYFGHRRFFQGLAWFLAQGNRLVVIRGNHDPQLYWPEVQLALIGWLKTAYDELRRECARPAGQDLPVEPGELTDHFPEMDVDDFEDRVDFYHSWYYYRERLAYLEHGGQYDAVNSHRYFLRPIWSPWQEAKDSSPPYPLRAVDEAPEAESQSIPSETTAEPSGSDPRLHLPRVLDWLPDLDIGAKGTEIDSAWGNVGLYLINILENEFPNFERPGYQKVYFKWLLYHRPALLVRKLIPALMRTLRAWVIWAIGTVGWGRDFVAGVRRRDQAQDAPEGRIRRFVDGGLRGDYDEKELKAYAQLTGLPLARVRELDRTPWVKRWRWPGSGLVYTGLNLLLFGALITVILLGLAELFDLFSVYEETTTRLPIPTEILDSASQGKYVFRDLLLDLVVMFVVGLATYWLITALRRFINLREDYLFRPAQRVAGILKGGWDVPYILFGHDHAHNAQPLRVGAWCTADHCVKKLRKRDLDLAAGRYLEIGAIDCAQCGAQVDPENLQHEVDKALSPPRPPERYTLRCRNCHTEMSVDGSADLSRQSLRCEFCGIQLTNEAVEGLPWAYLPDLGIDSLHCQCGEPLPQTEVEQARLLPPHVNLTCPGCATTERQWLGTWVPGCPECGRPAREREIHLFENRAILHCKCGHHYPAEPLVSRWYLNTGTWMHMFATERKRLVREALEYPFVRMINTHHVLASGPDDYMQPNSQARPKVQLLRWNDAAGRIETCETFRGADEDRWQSRPRRMPG